jgi:phospholipase D1/2
MPNTMCISRTSSSVCPSLSRQCTSLTFIVTATGDQQRPIFNTIGRAIVDACVRAGKEGRKFRVIIVIPAIPGFAGDLRDNAALGTRAIMDYQYKSICRGEHSIFGQIEKEGIDPRGKLFSLVLLWFQLHV